MYRFFEVYRLGIRVAAKIFLFLMLWCSWGYAGDEIISQSEQKEFIESFIAHYEFNPEGRYTHEYHPFLLDRTRQSFDALEKRLQNEQFSVAGRIVIMGYEENAVPQYYTNFRRSKIDDEAIRKSATGWSLRLHNRFGFMSGFLLKDLPWLTETYLKNQDSVFEHVDVQTIPLFDDRAVIFHQHAFGQALPYMQKERELLCRKLVGGKPHDVLKELRLFWQTLYRGAFKVGNKQIAGTQDVLFSIEYVHYLMNSPLPLLKFFIGPDLTYPIEITAKQDRFATVHAQHFVKKFAKRLQSIKGEKTVYVFCSFVDGVGKSTMLGNIKNWQKWSSDIEKFDHVDNSSSQTCDLFALSDHVFIADLPAQVSHFTYKPDGLVFVDVRTHDDALLCKELDAFVLSHRAELKEQGSQIFAAVKQIMATKGAHAPELHDPRNTLYAFAKNVVILGKEASNQWVPFMYDGKSYLFKDSKPLEIRYVASLTSVKSEGLKNIEAEQMLFFEGIRFPLQYGDFLDDLVKKFKEQQITQVVFVDFLSMYPRSSRENIRINYLLQQMALLDKSFTPMLSLYRDFVSGGELLHALLSPKTSHAFYQALQLEVLVRLTLFSVLTNRVHGDLTGLGLDELTTRLAVLLDNVGAACKKDIVIRVEKKMVEETKNLEALYGLSKSFVNIQQFSFTKVCALSSLLQDFFTNSFDHDATNDVWRHTGVPKTCSSDVLEGQRLKATLVTDQGVRVKGLFVFHPDCRQELLLTPCIRSLRACWYAAILNVLQAQTKGYDRFACNQLTYNIIPLHLVTDVRNMMYVLQHQYESWTEPLKSALRMQFRPFNLISNKPAMFASVQDIPCRVDWESNKTYEELFGFGYKLEKKQDEEYSYKSESPLVTVVNRYYAEHDPNTVIPTQLLWRRLQESPIWRREYAFRRDTAMQNGYKQPMDTSAQPLYSAKKLYLATQDERTAARMVIRLLATLEMVLKDPEATVVIRDGDHDDFKAALCLFERVVVPTYCQRLFSDNLWDDYDAIEPYPSWDYWDHING